MGTNFYLVREDNMTLFAMGKNIHEWAWIFGGVGVSVPWTDVAADTLAGLLTLQSIDDATERYNAPPAIGPRAPVRPLPDAEVTKHVLWGDRCAAAILAWSEGMPILFTDPSGLDVFYDRLGPREGHIERITGSAYDCWKGLD